MTYKGRSGLGRGSGISGHHCHQICQLDPFPSPFCLPPCPHRHQFCVFFSLDSQLEPILLSFQFWLNSKYSSCQKSVACHSLIKNTETLSTTPSFNNCSMFCSKFKKMKYLFICSDGYNAWRDATKPTEILTKLCRDNRLSGPYMQPGKIQVGDKVFTGQTVFQEDENGNYIVYYLSLSLCL